MSGSAGSEPVSMASRTPRCSARVPRSRRAVVNASRRAARLRAGPRRRARARPSCRARRPSRRRYPPGGCGRRAGRACRTGGGSAAQVPRAAARPILSRWRISRRPVSLKRCGASSPRHRARRRGHPAERLRGSARGRADRRRGEVPADDGSSCELNCRIAQRSSPRPGPGRCTSWPGRAWHPGRASGEAAWWRSGRRWHPADGRSRSLRRGC